MLTRYIEALSFAHYLGHASLVTFDEVQKTLLDANDVPVRAYFQRLLPPIMACY